MVNESKQMTNKSIVLKYFYCVSSCRSHVSDTGTFDQKLLTRTYVYVSKYVYIFVCIWMYIEEPESSWGAPEENPPHSNALQEYYPEELMRRILLRQILPRSSSGGFSSSDPQGMLPRIISLELWAPTSRRSYLIFHLDSNKQHFFSEHQQAQNGVKRKVLVQQCHHKINAMVHDKTQDHGTHALRGWVVGETVWGQSEVDAYDRRGPQVHESQWLFAGGATWCTPFPVFVVNGNGWTVWTNKQTWTRVCVWSRVRDCVVVHTCRICCFSIHVFTKSIELQKCQCDTQTTLACIGRKIVSLPSLRNEVS